MHRKEVETLQKSIRHDLYVGGMSKIVLKERRKERKGNGNPNNRIPGSSALQIPQYHGTFVGILNAPFSIPTSLGYLVHNRRRVPNRREWRFLGNALWGSFSGHAPSGGRLCADS